MSKLKGASTTPIIEEDHIFVREKPDPIPFRTFLYNKKEGTVLGRDGSSWGKLNIIKLSSLRI